MKLKNTGNSVISVGKTVILPGESADIKEKGYSRSLSSVSTPSEINSLNDLSITSTV